MERSEIGLVLLELANIWNTKPQNPRNWLEDAAVVSNMLMWQTVLNPWVAALLQLFEYAAKRLQAETIFTLAHCSFVIFPVIQDKARVLIQICKTT